MPHVVIIGAGAAGLGVARLLSHHDGFTVTILEATGRIGGRIKGVDVGTNSVDLGASWMHSIRENPVFDEALKQRWPMAFTDNVVGYYTQRGPISRDAGVVPIVEELRSMIAEDYHQEKPLKPETSLQSYVEAAVQSMPLITPNQARLTTLFMKQTEHFIGQPWHEIPAAEGGNPNELGRNAYVYGKGYSYFLDWLEKETNWSNTELKLNEEVQSMRRVLEGERLVLTTSQGAEYNADYVVCTIPLGVLKGKSLPLFGALDPPEKLYQAIVQTQLAELGKVVLRFKQPFWDTLEQELAVVNTNTKEVFSIVSPFNAESATLIVLMGPPVTCQVESNPSTAFDIVRWALEAIRVDPLKPVPQPVECVVTNWTQLPHFKCSYSARKIDQSYNDMIQPFIDGHGNLRFAGEHTTFDGNGCVHGAYLSGLREAQHILDCEKHERKKNPLCDKHHCNDDLQ